MILKNLGAENSIFNQFISELRNVNVQNDSMRFRRNLERIGEIAAYEISKTLSYEEKEIVTPLGKLSLGLPTQMPILATILRAGLPLHQGLLNFFDHSENAFIAAYRKPHQDNSFEIKLHYMATPSLEGRTLIISDPMLASGKSMMLAYEELLTVGNPAYTHIVSVIASQQGIDYIKEKMEGRNYTLWVGAIDKELTSKSYIVPGLGDAGDLAFGQKLDL
ncbi:MAG: uracil phosphoribosyltransferase [Bacteroidales bacterium]|nr:uracil phosphoribosyltransferase [Bacteroidales bacterium]